MKLIHGAIVFQLLSSMVITHAQPPLPDCKQRLDLIKSNHLSLSYEEFDQTQGEGWRQLEARGCHKESADLIGAYIESNSANQRSLVWHIAQLRAAEGDYSEALKFARLSLNANQELSQHPLRWNEYVAGVIAFLERDKETLVTQRENVAAGIDAYVGNAMNTRVLDMLITNFELSYAMAVSAPSTQ